MEELIQKSRILIEALPYIKKFFRKTFVIKYGGSAMKIKKYKEIFFQDVALLSYVGINIIIVHGGGDDISKKLQKMGKKSVFVEGHRVTDKETLNMAEKVLIGKINKSIVKELKKHNLKVAGVSGKDFNLIIAKKKLINNKDIGFVGEVKKINTEILKVFENSDMIPVIAPIGKDENGISYNINADIIAGKVAESIKADKLIYLTDMDGIKINGRYVSSMMIKDINRNIKNGQITSGMLPKVISAKSAILNGVKKVHIINGTVEHSLLLEIFTNKGIGTEIIKN
ncbi:MAG: acetylglutamate kinase [Candidatus Goldbacteria bacterium]|nr:acetylglutamate kinase [Candidatus Goldiibacteriota bacterium]